MRIEIEGSDKILAIAGVSEKGPQGDKGEQGVQGEIGPTGIITVHPENSLIYDPNSRVLVLNAGTFASGDLEDQVVLGGDIRLKNARRPNGFAGGDLYGSYPNPVLKNITTARTSEVIYKFTIDAKGRILTSTPATAADLNLGNVNNTSDLNKPISTATQSALNDKLSITLASSTYVPLNDLRLQKFTVQDQQTSSVRSIAGSQDGHVTAGTAITAAASDHSHTQIDNDVSLHGNRITNLHDVDANTEAHHAVNKKYVDQTAVGLKPHAPVDLATTGFNIELTGEQEIDGINVVTGNRILVKDQDNVYENGIYVANTDGLWDRAEDMGGPPSNNENWDQVKGALISVDIGDALSGTTWLASVDSNGVIGETDIQFVPFPIPIITEGPGINKFGSQISIDLSQYPQYPGLDTSNGLFVKAGPGIQVTDNGVEILLADDSNLEFIDSNYLSISSSIAGSGLIYTDSKINIDSDQSLTIDTLGDINTGAIVSSDTIQAESVNVSGDITAADKISALNIESTGEISGTWAGNNIGLDKGGLGDVDLSQVSPAPTQLIEYLSDSDETVFVDSTEGYALSGTIQISDEIISYESLGNDNQSFENLTRGYQGTEAVAHQNGAVVFDPTSRYLDLKSDQQAARSNLGVGSLSIQDNIVFKTSQTFAIQGNVLLNSDNDGLDIPSFFIMKGFPDQESADSSTVLSQIICKIGSADPDVIDPYAEFTIQKIDSNGLIETSPIKAFQEIQILNTIVPIWNITNSYAIGDIVLYNDDYYQCIKSTTDLTEPISFPDEDNYHWTLAEEVPNNSMNIDDTIDEETNRIIPTELKLNITGINGAPKNLTVTLIFEHVLEPH